MRVSFAQSVRMVSESSERKPTGTEILAKLKALPSGKRQDFLVAQIRAGHVPSFMNKLQEVPGPNGETLLVSPDYLCVGTDDDYVTVPLDRPHAEQLVKDMGGQLPTPQQVDAIEKAATCLYMEGQPNTGGLWGDQTVKNMGGVQRATVKQPGYRAGKLIAGHRKDIVRTPMGDKHPEQVLIYGGIDEKGHRIQALSGTHGAWYTDYSHGTRLVIVKP